MKNRGIPLLVLPAVFAVVCLFFAGRFEYLWGLLCSVVLFVAAYGIGRRILRVFNVTAEPLFFPFGLGCLLLVCYTVFAVSTNLIAIYSLWIVITFLCLQEVMTSGTDSPWRCRISFQYLWITPILLIGFWSSLTPSTFYDALVYHLGLPQQYLIRGRIEILPTNLFSSFPPFEPVCNLLLIGVKASSAIKLFSIWILLSTLWPLWWFGRKHETEEASKIVLPALLLPAAWILIHLTTADILTSLFFCSGVIFLLSLQASDGPSCRRMLLASAFLIACSVWTKWNVLLYIPPLIVLFKPQFSRVNLLRLFVLFAGIVFMIAPLLIRNYVTIGDPLYPILSEWLHNPNWSALQQHALQRDSFPERNRSILDLITKPGTFGSGSALGLVPIVGLVLYPFAANRKTNRLLLYGVICFSLWYAIFPNFRQLFPVFLVLVPVFAAGLSLIAARSKAVYTMVLIVCGLLALKDMVTVYKFFPLIRSQEGPEKYLAERTNYYDVAGALQDPTQLTILIGETRIAYFQVPVIANTAYDRNTFLEIADSSQNEDALYQKLKGAGISHIVYNPSEFERLSKEYKLWVPSNQNAKVLRAFFQKHVVLRKRNGNVFLFELK